MDRQHVGTAQIIRADSRHLPLADDTVDLVVTSPPYFALRSYQDGGEHYDGQIGDEPTPAEFVDALIEVTAECVRVLKPSGSLWVNLGDKYGTRSAGLAKSEGQIGSRAGARETHPRRPPAYRVARDEPRPGAVRDKSLMGLPWRYAIRCIDELELILRAEVIWSKPNGLPESVTDRVRRSHETWFHFTLQPRYYSAVDEIREQHTSGAHGAARAARTDRRAAEAERFVAGTTSGLPAQPGDAGAFHPLGKLPGSVWEIATEPLIVPERLGVDHFAAFPTEWPRRIIQGWAPAGVCVECGEGRRPVSGTTCEQCSAFRPNNAKECPDCGHRRDWKADRHLAGIGHGYDAGASTATDWSTPGSNAPRRAPVPSQSVSGGYACACPDTSAQTTPGVVLDPFGGTGTTALVAKALGRQGISVDMSADYCRLAEWRTNDPAQLAKAARRPHTKSAQLDGHADLLTMLSDDQEVTA